MKTTAMQIDFADKSPFMVGDKVLFTHSVTGIVAEIHNDTSITVIPGSKWWIVNVCKLVWYRMKKFFTRIKRLVVHK